VEDAEDAPWEEPKTEAAPAASGDAGSRAADIIAMIRKRQST